MKICSRSILLTSLTATEAFLLSKSIQHTSYPTSRRLISSMSSDTNQIPDIVKNLNDVKENMRLAAINNERNPEKLTLVAVSKTKPASDIQALYDYGHRNFGENYFQEITEKAPSLPSDIKWHFIGHLQSQKASKLVREVPNLHVVETVDSLKLASKLNNACATVGRTLEIYIQVHTSDEETKSGIRPDEINELVSAIEKECPQLKVSGLMTIGAPDDMSCFDKLVQCRVALSAYTGKSIDDYELSMGMSGDYQEAIARGATSIRVGSTIFGARDYSKK